MAKCLYCGLEYISHNPRRLYCSERCRRDFQNDRRCAERAEVREERERDAWQEKPHQWQDPWQICEEDDDAWDGRWLNALLDAPPIEDDAPWDVIAEPPRKTRKSRRKDKHAGQGLLPGMEEWIS